MPRKQPVWPSAWAGWEEMNWVFKEAVLTRLTSTQQAHPLPEIIHNQREQTPSSRANLQMRLICGGSSRILSNVCLCYESYFGEVALIALQVHTFIPAGRGLLILFTLSFRAYAFSLRDPIKQLLGKEKNTVGDLRILKSVLVIDSAWYCVKWCLCIHCCGKFRMAPVVACNWLLMPACN